MKPGEYIVAYEQASGDLHVVDYYEDESSARARTLSEAHRLGSRTLLLRVLNAAEVRAAFEVP
jgi:hypothetical protein